MAERSNLEILCDEIIPALLRRASPEEVFEERRRVCSESCTDYAFIGHKIPFCEKDLLPIPEDLCRHGYSSIAQSSPKCTKYSSEERYRWIESEEAQEARL